MDLVLATRNQHKAKEIQAVLGDLKYRILTLEVFPTVPEIEEDEDSYEKNAAKKARVVAQTTGKWSLGDDTGLEVDALNGRPGLYSARFAGKGVTYAQNRNKLLSLMANVPLAKRTARFRCAMALAIPGDKTRVAEGVIEGSITSEELGGGGFGYDPVFYLPEIGKTLAQLTFEEKNRMSHRAKALQQMRRILEDLKSGV